MENFAVSARKKFVMDKYFSQIKIVTPNNISKVFDVSARTVISSVDLVNNYLIVNGKIVANAVYLTDENKVESTETTLDFVEKQKTNFVINEIVGEDEIEIQSVSVSSSEIVCSVMHKTELLGIYRYLIGDATKTEEETKVYGLGQYNDILYCLCGFETRDWGKLLKDYPNLRDFIWEGFKELKQQEKRDQISLIERMIQEKIKQQEILEKPQLREAKIAELKREKRELESMKLLIKESYDDIKI